MLDDEVRSSISGIGKHYGRKDSRKSLADDQHVDLRNDCSRRQDYRKSAYAVHAGKVAVKDFVKLMRPSQNKFTLHVAIRCAPLVFSWG
jgi:hypothetical protein